MIRLRVLGESVVEIGEHEVGPEAASLFALALYLAFERDAHVTRQSLIDMLWPGSRGESGRHCLRQALYKLRQLGAPLRTTASHLELPGSAVTGDFLELAAGTPIDPERLRRAGSTFSEFLPGYSPRHSPRFAAWLEDRRGEVEGIVRRALAGSLLDLRARHRWADVELVARQCLRLDPLNEEATLALAESTALTGSKAQALSMLDRYLGELGPAASDIHLPATMLRRRIAERVPERRYSAVADACFEGREESMEVLAGLLAEARAGRGQACLIWGDAGIGKTRLAAECTKAAVLHGAQVVRVGCEPSDVRRPLSLFADAVPALLNLRGALGCSPASMSYLRRLTEHDPNASTPSEEALDAEFLFARVRRAIFDLVDAVASEGTLVVVAEDVHWLDRTSWEVLRAMIDWAATRKLLFLFSSRSEHPPGLPQDAPSLRLVRHRLGAITDQAAIRLVVALCEGTDRPPSADLKEWYVRVAEGNPLFLRELAREWAERGRADRIPASLVGVLEDRIHKLPATALRMLQFAALLGKHSTLARMEQATGFLNREVIEGALALEQSSLLSPEPGAFRPRHELIASTVLGGLGATSLRVMHRSIATALSKEIGASGNVQILWDCIAHWEAAGEPEQLPSLVTACAAMLIRIGLPRDAAAIFEATARFQLPPSERQAMLRGKIEALRLAGLWHQVSESLAALIAGRAVLSPGSDEHCLEELDLLEVECRIRGSSAGTVEKALKCARDSGAPADHRIAACAMTVRLADRVGDRETAEIAHALVTDIGEAHGSAARSDYLTCGLIYHSSYGSLTTAREIAAELVRHERAHGTPFSICQSLRYSWIPLMRLGALDLARGVATEALEIARRYRLASGVMSAADALTDTCLEEGCLDEATTWIQVASEWAASIEDDYLQSEQRRTRARLLLMQGNESQARRVAPCGPIELPMDAELRRYANTLSLALRLHYGGCTLDDLLTALRRAKRVLDQTRSLGGQDFANWCVCSTLELIGEKKEAYSRVTEYARIFRRELGPLPYYLLDLARKCSVLS